MSRLTSGGRDSAALRLVTQTARKQRDVSRAGSADGTESQWLLRRMISSAHAHGVRKTRFNLPSIARPLRELFGVHKQQIPLSFRGEQSLSAGKRRDWIFY